jgi:glycosyltransferase involved in cell wall biosynthesis
MSKVLFVIDTLEVGGAEKSILEIASRFKKYTPVVCHLYTGDELRQQYEAAGIEVISINVSGHYQFAQAASRLEQVIRRVQPAIIHSTLFRSDMVCRRLRRKNNIPLINSLVNNSYHKSRFEKASVIFQMKLHAIRLWDAITARKVDLFLSNSEAIRQSNAKALSIPLNKIKVIYRGRAAEQFAQRNNERIESLRAEWKIGSRMVLLNVSRLLERKGQLDLLRAFRRVQVNYPQTVLLIAGEGPFREMLEQEIKKMDLGENVHLLGTRDDVPDLLALATAFVFPSHYEGLPGALIEAMLARTPLVVSDIPENLECVQSGMAQIYPVGDLVELEKCIAAVLGNPQGAVQFAEAAHRVALKKFDIQEVAHQHETVYDELTAP